MRQKITVTLVAAFSLLLSLSGCSGDHNKFEISEYSEVDSSMSSALEEDRLEVGTVFVYVCGAVASPGVYSLKASDRIAVAVELAGGFLENAKTDYVNLAAYVTDGEKIYIPTIDEILSEASAFVEREEGLVNINTADINRLITIDGIGEAKAKAIISYRNEHGRFQSLEEIKKVSGIGNSTYEKIKEFIKI